MKIFENFKVRCISLLKPYTFCFERFLIGATLKALYRLRAHFLKTWKFFKFPKNPIFNHVWWVWVGWYVNGTGLFPGPGGGDSEYIFHFLVSCTVSEE